jgi:transcriptional regulator with XRE-family HTH domain
MKNERPYGANINTFGLNLKKIRKELGFTQERFAMYLEVSRTSLGAWEEGRAHPHIYVLLQICRRLKISDIAGFIEDSNFCLKTAKAARTFEGISAIEKRYCMLEPREKKAVDALMGIEG